MEQVDNIILKGPSSQKEKKKGKGILIIFFILLMILATLCGAYWYYINYIQETPKQAFFKYLGQTNLDDILNVDIYYTILDKISAESFKTSTKASVSTTKETDFTKQVDISKFDLNLDIISDKKSNGTSLEGKILYSSNDFFDLKLINTKDSVGIGSTAIYDKYIATSKDEYSNSVNKLTGLETDISVDSVENKVTEISQNSIDFEEEYEAKKIEEYSQVLLSKIPEEAVSENENVVVTLDSKTVNTKAYILALNNQQYKEVLSTFLTKLKEDTELLENLVNGVEKVEEIDDNTNTINQLTNVKVDYSNGETENLQMSIEADNTSTEILNDEELNVVKDLPDENLVNSELEVVKDLPDETLVKEDETKTELFEDLISALILNQKIDGTAQDIIKDIDIELSNLKNINEGIKIAVYVRNEENFENETVKVVAELPNKETLDIEYQTENKVKITSLKEGEKDEKTITQGKSVQIERTTTDMATKFNIKVSEIEDKKVVKKTEVVLETKGTESSKKYTNEAIVTINDNEGELKINLENTIDFGNADIQENFTDENTIFIDKLSEEETSNLVSELIQNITKVYTEKMSDLNFIDNNVASSVIEQPEVEENPEEKAQIKQKLIETVSNMMGEAQANNEEFTIQNLDSLAIEGYDVSCVISNELATVEINGYTFKIDANFILSE